MSLNYLRGFHIPFTNYPMFIEVGASLAFNKGSYVDEEYDLDFNHNRPTVSIDSRNTFVIPELQP